MFTQYTSSHMYPQENTKENRYLPYNFGFLFHSFSFSLSLFLSPSPTHLSLSLLTDVCRYIAYWSLRRVLFIVYSYCINVSTNVKLWPQAGPLNGCSIACFLWGAFRYYVLWSEWMISLLFYSILQRPTEDRIGERPGDVSCPNCWWVVGGLFKTAFLRLRFWRTTECQVSFWDITYERYSASYRTIRTSVTFRCSVYA